MKLNFQKKLFLNFSVIILILIIVFSSSFYKYSSQIISNSNLANSKQVTEKISNQIDMRFKQLSIAALSISYSEAVQKILYSLNNDSSIDSGDMVEYTSTIRKNLGAIFYSLPDITRTTIFNSRKKFYIYYGLTKEEPEIANQRINDIDWYDKLIDSDNLAYMMPPHPDDWSGNPELVVSLFRKISNQFSSDFGIIEIQEPYSVLKNTCKIESLSDESSVIILDSKGNLVFPFKPSQTFIDYYQPQTIYEKARDKSKGSGELGVKGGKNLLFSFCKSDYTDWTVILASSQTSLLKQLGFYRNMIIAIGLIILAIALFTFFMLSRKLTKPLQYLISTVGEVNLDNMSLEVKHEGYDEFKILNESFNSMFSKLKDSINKVYESKIRETNAHFLALQAQMNPHFLYNTLNVISATNEEEGSLTGAKMCNQLSEMMRYIISPINSIVTMVNEINYAGNYLELMKKHYEEYLNYEMDIPMEMNSIMLPKITIQPLVENCINHGFENILPPWNIVLKGRIINNEKWELTLEDNGSGFKEEVLDNLNRQLQEYYINLSEGNFKENLSIGGMGVLNTYARLAIYFKENTVFTIRNRMPSGSIVTIGGKIVYKGDA